MSETIVYDELWKTTPVGTIGKRLEDWVKGEQVNLRSFAEGVAEEFLYDLSADGPVVVLNGETFDMAAWLAEHKEDRE